jgi:biofilm PGA synthesis N-glycosyltransferase PgaC
LKTKFIVSLLLGSLWLGISIYFALFWAHELTPFLPDVYVWGVIIGIALLPGFLMSTMFFSNILHMKPKNYPDTCQNTTIIMCARNEEKNIKKAICAIINQKYYGHIRLLVVDNASQDKTAQIIKSIRIPCWANVSIEYICCCKPGKANALNCGLSFVKTQHFITVDADTFLEPNAVQKIMNHIVAKKSACVAANLFVNNTYKSLATKIQNYDYLLSIAAVKRFQGSYNSTLVAQGAFSAYQTQAVKKVGGWQNVLGEDIVLTYQLLHKKLNSTYEPLAVGYTNVPETVEGLYSQRKRWAIGMIEGLTLIKPWQQPKIYTKFFTFINLAVIYLDIAFIFGFIPGIILAFFGFYYILVCIYIKKN